MKLAYKIEIMYTIIVAVIQKSSKMVGNKTLVFDFENKPNIDHLIVTIVIKLISK